jgi:hypothetical protein
MIAFWSIRVLGLFLVKPRINPTDFLMHPINMWWLLGIVGVSAYVLYTNSVPKITKTPDLTGVLTPSKGDQWNSPTIQGSNYAVKPSRYQVGNQMVDVGLPSVNPPTRNGQTSVSPFSGDS